MPSSHHVPESLRGRAILSTDAANHDTTRRRLRGRDVEHPHHGVSSVGLDLSTVEDRVLAYLPLLGEQRYLSHSSAALLFGVPLPARLEREKVLHVSAFNSCRPRGRGIVGHELGRLGIELTTVNGIPVIGPADTFVHLAAMLGENDLIAAGDFLVSGKRTAKGRLPALCTLQQLRQAAVRHRGRRGLRGIHWVLARLRSPVDSRAETLLRLLLVSGGFPEPLVGDATLVDGGAAVLHPDLKWRQWRIVLEYEGDGHRTDPRRFRSDITRVARFEAADWRVIRVTSDELYVHQDAFLSRVADVIALRQRTHP